MPLAKRWLCVVAALVVVAVATGCTKRRKRTATQSDTVDLVIALRIDAVSGPAEVDAGQVGVQVSVVVSNLGDVPLDLSQLALDFSADASSYTSTADVGNPTSLAAQASETLLVSVDVAATATLGTATIDASLVADDAAHAVQLTATGALLTHTWTVRGVFEIASVSGPSQVLTGARRVPVTVELLNRGSQSVDITSIALSFDASSGDFLAVPVPGGPSSIGSNSSASVEFGVDVAADAALGFVEVDALGMVQNPQNGAIFSQAGATSPLTWEVQQLINNPPRFGGVHSVATAGGAIIRVDWLSALDDRTDVAAMQYEVYLASSSGGQSFASPTFTTSPGALFAILDNSDSPLIQVDTEVFAVVRALDGDGDQDGNEVEVAVIPVAESSVRFIDPSASGGAGSLADPYDSLQAGIDDVEAISGGGVLVVANGTLSAAAAVVLGATAEPSALYGRFDFTGLSGSSTRRQVLEARESPSSSAETLLSGATLAGSESLQLRLASGERTALDGLVFENPPLCASHVGGDLVYLLVSGCTFSGLDRGDSTGIGIVVRNRAAAPSAHRLRVTGSTFNGRLEAGIQITGRTLSLLTNGNTFQELAEGINTEQYLFATCTFGDDLALVPPTGQTLVIETRDNLFNVIDVDAVDLRFAPDDPAMRADIDWRFERNLIHAIDNQAIEVTDFSYFGDGGDNDLGTASFLAQDNDFQSVIGQGFQFSELDDNPGNAHGHLSYVFRGNRYTLLSDNAIEFSNLIVRDDASLSIVCEDEVAQSLADDYLRLNPSSVDSTDNGAITVTLERADFLNLTDEGIDIEGDNLLPQDGSFVLRYTDGLSVIVGDLLDLFELGPMEATPTSAVGSFEVEISTSTLASIDDEAVDLELNTGLQTGPLDVRFVDNASVGGTGSIVLVEMGLNVQSIDLEVARNSSSNGTVEHYGVFGNVPDALSVMRFTDNSCQNSGDEFVYFELLDNPNGVADMIVVACNNFGEFLDDEGFQMLLESGQDDNIFVAVTQNTFVDIVDEAVNLELADLNTRLLIANNALGVVNDNDSSSGAIQAFIEGTLEGSVEVYNNIIAQTTTHGVLVDNADLPAQIVNNTFSQTGSGFDFGAVSTEGTFGAGFSQVFVENCILSEAAGFNMGPDQMEARYSLADRHFPGLTGYENVFANPLFSFLGTDRDFEVYYSLLSASAAIDAGNPASRYDDNDGSRNDMGAFGGPGGYGVGVQSTSGCPLRMIGTVPFLGLSTGASLSSLGVGDSLRLVFTDELDAGTVTSNSIRLMTSSGVHPATLTVDGHYVHLYPSSALPAGETVTLQVLAGGLQASSGRELQVPSYVDFATKPTASAESEPNDAIGSADDLGASSVVELSGTLDNSEEDFFRIDGLVAGERLQVSVFNIRILAAADTCLELLDATGNLVLDANDDAFGRDAYLDHVFTADEIAASSGVFFLHLDERGQASGPEPYTLVVVRR